VSVLLDLTVQTHQMTLARELRRLPHFVALFAGASSGSARIRAGGGSSRQRVGPADSVSARHNSGSSLVPRPLLAAASQRSSQAALGCRGRAPTST
jgi:hypothetical protein